jgi:excisionase family DNA binding protein
MNRLLTCNEVANLLGVKPSTIYQWTHQGYIPHIKLGRVVRFRQDDIAKWLDKRADGGRTSRRVPVDFK